MSAIKVGDLVVVVRGGCSDEHIGEIFTVAEIRTATGVCRGCGTYHGYRETLVVCPVVGGLGFEIQRLKKIDPLSDLEGQKDSSGLDERHSWWSQRKAYRE